MTITELDQIAARAEKATPGPWFASNYLDTEEVGVITEDNTIVVGLSSRITKPIATFIAASRQDIPALVAFAREQLAELDRLKARLRTIYDECEPYADGAEDATIHDKLCNRIAHLAKP